MCSSDLNKVDNFMPCPCVDCRNVREYSNSKTIQGHVLRRGFMPSYNCWTKHGERGVRMEDNEEEEDDDNYPMFPEECGDTVMEDVEEEGGEHRASDEPADGLGGVPLFFYLPVDLQNNFLVVRPRKSMILL